MSMKRYKATFTWRAGASNGECLFHADSDQEAMAEMREFVRSGRPNETQATIEFDDFTFTCRNVNGVARCKIVAL